MRLSAKILGLALLLLLVAPFAAYAAPAPAANDSPALPPPGKKIPLGPDHYFTYGFEKPPKVATCIMRVEIFGKDGKRDTTFTVKGDVDMPSMRGVHARGEKDFAISKKGVYLLPAPLVMPGDWEFRFTFLKNGKTVLRGAYLFDL